jgi:ferredoxin-type protein NapH
LDPLLLRWHGICAPVFHCYSCPLATFACPIGILANYSAFHVFPYLAVGTLLMVGAVFGSLVCGWACPFGFLQDLIGRIPTPKLRLPGLLGLTRYAVLAGLVVLIPYFYGETHQLFICRVCPAGGIEGSGPYSLPFLHPQGIWEWQPTTIKTIIMIVFLLATLFTWRPWCTLFCPLGAIFSLCNYGSLIFLRFQPNRCKDCELCRDLCKYRGPAERRGSDMRCIRCLECIKCQALTVGTVFQKQELVSLETEKMTEQT